MARHDHVDEPVRQRPRDRDDPSVMSQDDRSRGFENSVHRAAGATATIDGARRRPSSRLASGFDRLREQRDPKAAEAGGDRRERRSRSS